MGLVHRSPNSDEVNQTLITLTNTSVLIAGSHNYLLLPPEDGLGLMGACVVHCCCRMEPVPIRDALTKDRQFLDSYAPCVLIMKEHIPRLAGPS